MLSVLRRLFDRLARTPRTIRRSAPRRQGRAHLALEALETRMCPTTATWTGADALTNPDWSNVQNWQGGILPQPGNSLVFAGSSKGGSVNDLNPGTVTVYDSIAINGNGFAISGYPIGLKEGLTNSGNNTVISMPLTLTANETITDNAGASLTLAGAVNLNTYYLTFVPDGNIQYIGPSIGGSGGVTVNGNAKFILADTLPDTYTGVTTVAFGTMYLSGSEGNSVVGDLAVGQAVGFKEAAVARLTSSNQIADTSAVFIDTTGLVDCNGYCNTIGPLTMHGGFLTTGTGTVTLNANVTTLACANAAVIGAGPQAPMGYLALGTNLVTFTTADGTAGTDLNITTVVEDGSSSAGLIKAGPGTMQLTNSNTYSGSTLVSAGTLVAANANALGTIKAGTTVNSGATLTYQDPNADSTFTMSAEPLTLNGGTLLVKGNSPIVIAPGPLNLAADSTIQVNAGITFEQLGPVTGPGGFTKAWAGELDLMDANTYTGLTILSDGVLGLYNAQALGSGGAKVTGQGILQLENGLTYAAEAVALGGTLLCNGDATWVGAINLIGDANIDVAANDTLLLDASISGPAANSLTIGDSVNFPSATGSVWLNDANSYAGATEVSEGTLVITNADSLGSPANKANNNGTTVDAGASLDLVGGMAFDPTESLTLNGFGFNNAGALVNAAGNNSWNGTIQLASNTAIDAAPGTTLTINGVISGPGNLTIAGGGTVVLAGTNTFAGYTMLTAGILSLDNAQALGGAPYNGGAGTTIFDGATLQLDGFTYVIEPLTICGTGVGGTAGAVESLTDTNIWGPVKLGDNATITSQAGSTFTDNVQIANEGYLLTVNNVGDVTLGTAISGAGALTETGPGTLTFSGPSSNSYGGPTLVNGGTLVLSKPASAVAIAGAGVTINHGGTLAGTGMIDTGVVVNPGGMLTFAGTINGSVTNSGTVDPAGPEAIGTLTINGNFTQTSCGTLDMEIASAKLYDQLIVSGTASLAGTLNVILINGFQPKSGEKFPIITFGSSSGSFGTVNLPPGMGIVYDPLDVTIVAN